MGPLSHYALLRAASRIAMQQSIQGWQPGQSGLAARMGAIGIGTGCQLTSEETRARRGTEWKAKIPMIHAWGWGGGEFGGNSAKEFEKGNMNWLNLNPSFPKEKKRVTTVVRNLRNIVKKQQKGCSPRVRGAPNRPKPGNVLICGFLLFHSYYLSLVISFIYRTKTLTVTRKHI